MIWNVNQQNLGNELKKIFQMKTKVQGTQNNHDRKHSKGQRRNKWRPKFKVYGNISKKKWFKTLKASLLIKMADYTPEDKNMESEPRISVHTRKPGDY